MNVLRPLPMHQYQPVMLPRRQFRPVMLPPYLYPSVLQPLPPPPTVVSPPQENVLPRQIIPPLLRWVEKWIPNNETTVMIKNIPFRYKKMKKRDIQMEKISMSSLMITCICLWIP
ncbi:hypothetical protein AABB24_023290 [Solanum stoloniferum]|uniref:Uncharacterized protein n=1 Tax=Solanum stoloniferum TaxID=62892 RepID=A0ABD2T450_9SOLN